MLASYPLAVRRLRDFAISFLQIPPRDGHPCLDGWFRSLRSMGDLHPLNAYHYSTHQPGLAAPQSTRVSGKRKLCTQECVRHDRTSVANAPYVEMKPLRRKQ